VTSTPAQQHARWRKYRAAYEAFQFLLDNSPEGQRALGKYLPQKLKQKLQEAWS
jgi:hypothetical protein